MQYSACVSSHWMDLKYEQKVVCYPHNIHDTILYMHSFAMLIIIGVHGIHCWLRLLITPPNTHKNLTSIIQYYKTLPSRKVSWSVHCWHDLWLMCLLFSAIGLYSHGVVSSQEQWQCLALQVVFRTPLINNLSVNILHMIKGYLLTPFGFWKVYNLQYRAFFICTCKDYWSVAFIRVCFHCSQTVSSPSKGSKKK